MAGCSTGPVTEAPEKETIYIGGIMPLTEGGAAYGLPAQIVAQSAVERINEQGGVNGKNLAIIWEDGKCNVRDASTATQSLVNVDEVKVILGGFCSDETLAAAQITEDNDVILFSSASSSPKVTNAGDFVFRNYPSDSSQGKLLAQIAQDLEMEKVGILTEETDYAIGIEETFIAEFEGETVKENYLSTDTDLKTQITKLKSSEIDGLILNPQTPDKADLMLKQATELGIEDIVLMSNDAIVGNPETLDRYKEATEGLIGGIASYNEDHPDYSYMIEKYAEKKPGEELPFQSYMATTFDAVNILAQAIEASGEEMDTTKIRDYIYNYNGEGIAGQYEFDENGDPKSGHNPVIVCNAELMPYETGMTCPEKE
jgi:branched-chain amino acid transport system substrate-binding protein